MRYFFISHSCTTEDGYKANGDMAIKHKSFPRKDVIKKTIEKDHSVTQVIITSMFEFKSEKDFESFIK